MKGGAAAAASASPPALRHGVVGFSGLPAIAEGTNGNTYTTSSSAAAAAPALGASSNTTATYTGAAILKTYTNRRKMLQKASALASQMHKQVEDVVQMEEEQRLLSQAYRSRQKLAEQEQEQAQQKSRQKKQNAVKANASAQGGTGGSPEQNAVLSPLSEADGGSNAGDVDGDTQVLSPTSTADGYGVVLEGAPDTKRMLQHQAHEKNETLGKMRGMQLAIQELTAEAAAEEERYYARPKFNSEAPPPLDDDPEAAEGEQAERSARHEVPPDVIGKLDAIRDLRMALKDMLDARRGHPADSGSYGGIDAAASGSTWVEQDAMYNPPAPPQVFSTGALAVSLEYVSDSVASLARIADEFCLATTFRARSDRLVLLPHLASLEKWSAQTERCLDTIQRHLRHFHIGETAVLEGGAYEVNSLREQTLMLKETLTAQDQKVKSTTETKVATLHRLRDIHRRCRMWETHLLHRRTADTEAEARLLESPVLIALSNGRPSHTAESVSMHSSSSANHHRLLHTTPSSTDYTKGTTTATTATGETGVTANVSPCSTFLSPAAGGSREESGIAEPRRHQKLSFAGVDDASPPPRAPTAILKDFLRPTGPHGDDTGNGAQRRRHGGPPSPTAMDRMERRIARSWGNPYVRKRLLRQQVEAAERVQQLQQQQEDEEEQRLLAGSTSSPMHDPLAVEGQMAATDLRTPSALRTRHGGGHLPVTPNIIDGENATHRFPHLPSSRAGAEMSATAVTTNNSNHRHVCSSAAELSVAGNSVSTGVAETDMIELADARTVQLLQSLLRSVPVMSQRARNTPGTSDSAAPSAAAGGGAGRPDETPLGTVDVVEDAAARDACRQSIQRLMQFLDTQ